MLHLHGIRLPLLICVILNIPAAGAVTATDNCDADVPVIFQELSNTVVNGCGEIIRTWTAIDDCGNESTFTQTITVQDTEPPLLSCPTAQTFCDGAGNNYIIPDLIANDNCSGQLSITYDITGATQRNGTGINTSGIFNLGISTITWTVTDACNNTSTCTTTITITGITEVEIVPANATCDLSNGSFAIGPVTGGTAPYTFSVNGSPFSNTTDYTNLAAGTYTIIVHDANDCEFTTTITIDSDAGPSALELTPVDATCGLNNGSFIIGTVTGGTAPYTFSVDGNPFTTQNNYDDLNTGTHTVIVRDANGCEFTTSVDIGSSNGPTALEVTPTAAGCTVNNGTIAIGAVGGGTAPFEYSIDGGAFSGNDIYPNLAGGTHTVVVRDANGCEFSVETTITTSNGPTALEVVPTAAGCTVDNGTLTIGAVGGGTAPYTYSVDGSPFTSTISYTDLGPGAHNVIVRDANGCEFSVQATIATSTPPVAIETNTDDATCGLNNGAVTIVNVSGGTAPYTYSVDGSPFGASANIPDLAAGSHSVTVRDANGCEFTVDVDIMTSNGPTAIDITPTPAACGLDNGSFTINGTTGGIAPYQYSVDGGGFGATTSFPNLSAGTHSVTVRDANGCEFTVDVDITT